MAVIRGRRYLPKGLAMTPWYMDHILISSPTNLQRDRSRSTVTVTSFLYQRWRVWTLLTSRTCSHSPRKYLPSDDGFVLSSSCWTTPLINACSGNGVLSLCILLIVSWYWIAHLPLYHLSDNIVLPCIRLHSVEIHPKFILFVNICTGTGMTGTLERCRDDGNV